MIETLAQVRGTHKGRPFTAGLVLWDDRVVEVAPILWRFRKRSRGEVRAACRELGWSVSVVWQMERADPYKAEPITSSGRTNR